MTDIDHQIRVIQAFKDGRTIRRLPYAIRRTSGNYIITTHKHDFDFSRNEYTIEPLYRIGEVISITEANSQPQLVYYRGEAFPRCGIYISHTPDGSKYARTGTHRKQTQLERGAI